MRAGRWWSLILALALALAALTSMGSVRASDDSEPPDLTGAWQLDPDASDRPGGPRAGMGRGGFGGGPGGGMGGGRPGGMSGRRTGGRGGRSSGGEVAPEGAGGRGPSMRLPHRMHVTQTAQLVSFEDSTGAVLREVVTTPAEADTFTHAPMAEVVHGIWNGDKLETKRTGPSNTPIVETYTLEGDGKRLVIRTELPGNEQMPARTLKRVYRRSEE